MNRFNHELVFGISVKNLSKAERLIYGDSLMTHAMILTAVTDKVCLHKYTAQVCFCSANSCKHTVRMQADQRKHQGFLLCVYVDLIGCSFYISPLISYPSCSLLQSPLLTLIFLSSSLFLSLRTRKEAMRSGGWKTPGAMTVGTKVTNTLLHSSYFQSFPLGCDFFFFLIFKCTLT